MSVLDLVGISVYAEGRMPLADFLTVAETAKRLGISERGVQKLIQRELLLAEKHGRMYFIHKNEVARYQRERREPGRPKTKRKYTRQKERIDTKYGIAYNIE